MKYRFSIRNGYDIISEIVELKDGLSRLRVEFAYLQWRDSMIPSWEELKEIRENERSESDE